MLSQAMDLVFTDSLAFAVNATLGTVVRTKLCNYSWEQKVTSDSTKQEIRDLRGAQQQSDRSFVNGEFNHQMRESHS
jgi:hypothetical protein